MCSYVCLFPFQVFKDKVLELGEKLLPAFNTPTGIPRGVINLGRWVSAPAFTFSCPPSTLDKRRHRAVHSSTNVHLRRGGRLFHQFGQVIDKQGMCPKFSRIPTLVTVLLFNFGIFFTLVFFFTFNSKPLPTRQKWTDLFEEKKERRSVTQTNSGCLLTMQQLRADLYIVDCIWIEINLCSQTRWKILLIIFARL